MSRLFNTVSVPFKKRNRFNLSHESRLTTDFGRLTPILCEPVLPNDRFQISCNLRVDFAPMKFPVMQRFAAYVHYFFVPNRLLWDQWEEFITGGEDGTSEPSYPTIALDPTHFGGLESLTKERSLMDYLGFPTQTDPDDYYIAPGGTAVTCNQVDALPFRAYQLIFNEWYRDQNLSEEIDILKGVSGSMYNRTGLDFGAQIVPLMELRQRAWKKDYFTSALKDPQRGPDVTLPLVGDMTIEGDGQVPLSVVGYQDPTDPNVIGGMEWDQVADSDNVNVKFPVAAGNMPDVGDPVVLKGNMNADAMAAHLTNSTEDIRSATINEVRRAFAIQRWYELAARAGSRYVEQILAHFGIRSSDARLQRPEYLGGTVVPVMVGDVLQTSETDGTPLGTPAGVGQGAGVVRRIRRTFEEHGWIIGILSVIPEASYFQGMPRKFLKRKKFDFAWPLLANLGEQEIEKQELYFDGSASLSYNMEGFGYTPRYAEYKYAAGQVHGDFRTNLADFHDARVFGSRPALNESFVQVATDPENPDDGLNRIFAVRSSMVDHLWVHLYNNVQVRRVLPKYGTPI